MVAHRDRRTTKSVTRTPLRSSSPARAGTLNWYRLKSGNRWDFRSFESKVPWTHHVL